MRTTYTPPPEPREQVRSQKPAVSATDAAPVRATDQARRHRRAARLRFQVRGAIACSCRCTQIFRALRHGIAKLVQDALELLVFTGRKHRQQFGLHPESDRLELADNFFALISD